MAISRILIHHFRNITQADLQLSPHFNFLVGDNGSGKTSLLEAVYMLGHGRAFRHQQSNRVIQYEQPELVLHGKILLQDQQHTIGLSKSRSGENKVKIDGDEGFKIAELAQLLPIQLITPEGFDLLNGGPKYRRSFLDWGCFHHHPAFFSLWNNLRRLMKQRNAALRQVSRYDQIKHWDKELIPIAEQVSQIRAEYAEQIVPEIIKTSASFLPEYQLECQFYQGWDRQTSYAEILAHQFERDRQLTYTSLGPHKADLRLRVNHIPVEDLFSRGQLKLLMCALRLAQGEYYTTQSKQACIYLIDDFASELDQDKRQLLANRLKATQAQVFISAVSQDQITHMIDEKDKIFYVRSGIISN
ncbi:DNA replication/repair protein RecF [Zophobihabitans entericus]|uniref:DNA replication and repair protein RecF n=1 Tax=Zophobihabitans entericus TaxID=1635327 RepID=A0A6G9I7M6_9GAMM|nr:DNA replication/repair protein RecF [Zophobihabitans entericus]QIQ20206.1 DNA replication/repair protein RecF [Zophobihabitans entericus]